MKFLPRKHALPTKTTKLLNEKREINVNDTWISELDWLNGEWTMEIIFYQNDLWLD